MIWNMVMVTPEVHWQADSVYSIYNICKVYKRWCPGQGSLLHRLILENKVQISGKIIQGSIFHLNSRSHAKIQALQRKKIDPKIHLAYFCTERFNFHEKLWKCFKFQGSMLSWDFIKSFVLQNNILFKKKSSELYLAYHTITDTKNHYFRAKFALGRSLKRLFFISQFFIW